MKLKNITTLTKVLGSIGVIGLLGVIIWHIIYPDASQFIISIMICIFWFGFTYLCEWTREMRLEKIKLSVKYKQRYEDTNNRLDAQDMWIKKELTKLNNHETIHPDE